MKLPKNFTASFLTAIVSVTLAGCQTHTTTVPLSGGYEEVAHPHHALIDDPDPPRISFQYRATDGTVTPIWPSLYGVNDVIKGNVAIFVAEKAYIEPDRVTHPRLFAVKSPELPLDITDEVLWRWAKANGKDFSKTLESFSMVNPMQKSGGLEVSLEFTTSDKWTTGRDDWPEQSALHLDWGEVEQILNAVKTKGVEEKDLRWHTSYIGERF